MQLIVAPHCTLTARDNYRIRTPPKKPGKGYKGRVRKLLEEARIAEIFAFGHFFCLRRIWISIRPRCPEGLSLD